MAAVPDADRIHTSSLCCGGMDRTREREREEENRAGQPYHKLVHKILMQQQERQDKCMKG